MANEQQKSKERVSRFFIILIYGFNRRERKVFRREQRSCFATEAQKHGKITAKLASFGHSSFFFAVKRT